MILGFDSCSQLPVLWSFRELCWRSCGGPHRRQLLSGLCVSVVRLRLRLSDRLFSSVTMSVLVLVTYDFELSFEFRFFFGMFSPFLS